ncbi:hypothetical protein [Arcicella rigui]|uniref:Uncharacterized protein n=1 Tax=Arcicella rigui TaxID=797020 RepID=A0ABU5QCU9_9BACT|nr:hypothetical protein [Arcicella rigui]MEA5140674.1 hypothetical protein [Arcicella rigui]
MVAKTQKKSELIPKKQYKGILEPYELSTPEERKKAVERNKELYKKVNK